MSAEAVGALVAGLALALNAWSMFYLARQTRTATRQTVVAVEQAKVSNAVAAAAANDTVLRSLREVHAMMLQHEGMRAYFYGDKPLPGDGPERERVLTLGELLADVLASGVHVHERIPDSESAGPWADYCRHTIRSSPVLRHLLHEHPAWWPTLLSVLPDQAPNAGLRVPPPTPAR